MTHIQQIDIISAPLFAFYLEIQKISNHVADPESQHVNLWESRPAPLRLQMEPPTAGFAEIPPGKTNVEVEQQADKGHTTEVENHSTVLPCLDDDKNLPASPEDFSEDEEDFNIIAKRAQYDRLGGRLLEKERRLGRLRIRSKQAIIHHTFTALRLDDIEKELKELKAAISNRQEDPEDSQNSKFPIHQHMLRRSSIQEFRITRESVLLPRNQQPALEVQLAGGLDASTGLPTSSSALSNANAPAQAAYQGTPERLRIMSRPLLLHLRKLVDNAMLFFVSSDDIEEVTVYSAMVFLRPFKLFVKNDAAIRESLAQVESQIQQEASTDTISSSNGDKQDRGRENNKDEFDKRDLLADLKLLIDFLDTDLQPTYDLRRQIKDGTVVEIEYADLWHLFERGDAVVSRASQAHAHLVVNFAGGRDYLIQKLEDEDEDNSAPMAGFIIDCLGMGTDGCHYTPKLEKIVIRKFYGKKLITSLAVYPLRFDKNADAQRAKFVESGKHFMEVTRGLFCHKIFRGKTLDEPSYNIDGQVIVDMSLAMDAKPEWRTNSTVSEDDFTPRDNREIQEQTWCKHSHSSEGCYAEAFVKKIGATLGPVEREDLGEKEMMIMQPYVHAFVLRSRQWVTVRTTDLHEVEFESGFNDLVLPDNHKTTVQALVKTHENMRASQDPSIGSSSIEASLDLVKGKGSGLVILLHGPPGVGKTSTAECVADDTKRPLYPITCGDIGETAAEVESSLQYNFRLTHKWGCVLLLDEADIFLAKRTRSDLRHNAVTSVFLRSLEYYAGILFLTTNRVGAIDPAFKSRIQMSLFYARLNLDVTLKLYEKFIKRAKAE
ncbi:hypothetical protein ACJ41O_005740 [Fusarium nematophilum]